MKGTDALSCGERVIRCLTGEAVDHVPYGVGIGWSPWKETLQRWRRESGNPTLDPAQELGFEGSFALPAIEPGLLPGFEPLVLEETAEFIVSRDQRGFIRRDRRDYGSMPEFLDYPVKTPDDWTTFKRERLKVNDPGRITQNWDEFRARLRVTGEAVQVGCFPYGVFGTPRDFVGAEELLVGFYMEPDMIHDMMEHLTTLWLALWEKVAAEIQIHHIHIWEDMSGRQGSLISPAMVEEFMMPSYDRIARFARTHGVRVVSVDTDGACHELVPLMMKHGINMFFPFEVQASNDILEYRRCYPELGIMGGLDKRALARTKADVVREVEKAATMVKKGRYIPGFDHVIPPDVPWANFRYAAERIREVCFG